MTNVYDVWFIPKGAPPETHLRHELAADEWPADLDTAVTAILARYERDYGTVVAIFYAPTQRQLYRRHDA